jgi:SAM-dependent methyltransferase
MKPLEWSSEREFTVDGVRFRCDLDDYSAKTDRERFVLLKARTVLDDYATVLAGTVPQNVLEFGIFQGGSPALFSLWFDAVKVVGIDICQPVEAFDEFCRTHPAGSSIRSYYGVSQTDAARIEQIVREEFGATPLDLIVDDASHHYKNTRRTFEIAFPLLRPGGTYVIEDWGWAHWPGGSGFYASQTPLSMLIMELLMLCASRSDLIEEVRVFPAFAFVRKARHAPPLAEFALDGAYLQRDLALVGTQNLHLRGVAQLIGKRLLKQTRRRLKRILGR